MKKLLIILMVVAMASFLFVGCLGVTPPVDGDEDDEDEEDVTPPAVATATPVITAVAGIDITASGQYISNAEAAVVIVTGTAAPYSEVKVYINGTVADTGVARANATFDVVMAKADLGTDGAKTLYVTATETGFNESAHSNECAFKLDTAAPGILAVKATAETGWVNSAVLPIIGAGPALPIVGVHVTAVALTANFAVETGTWTLICTLNAAAGTVDTQILSPSGTLTTVEAIVVSTVNDTAIPGLNITFAVAAVGKESTIVVSSVGAVAPIRARASLKFDEAVTLVAALAGTYADTFIGANTVLALLIYQNSNRTYYWRGPEVAAGVVTIILGNQLSFSATGVADAAGNVSSATAKTCIVEAASLVLLAPTD